MQKVYLESCLSPFPMSSCKHDKVLPNTSQFFFHSLFHGDPQKYLDSGDFLIFHHFLCPKQLVLMFPSVQQVLLVRVVYAFSQVSIPDPPFLIFHHLPVHVRVWRPQSIPRNFSGHDRSKNHSVDRAMGDLQPHTRSLASYQKSLLGSSSVDEKLVKCPSSLPFWPLHIHTHTYTYTQLNILVELLVWRWL